MLDRHQTCKLVMVSVGSSIFLRHLDANFVKKMTEMSDLCYLQKPRLELQ